MIRRVVKICDDGVNFSENCRNFPKNFLDLDSIGNQGIINLSYCSSKRYVAIVLSDSKIVFLGEGAAAVFCLFLYCVFLHSVA